MRGPHSSVRLPRALHSRGRVPSREFLYRCLEVRVIGGAEQQQQQQRCQQWQHQSPPIREEGGGRRGYHHAGPSQLSQAPEGAPLPRQGPIQRVSVQVPGSASHRRSRAATTTAAVSAVATSITINQRGGGGGEDIIMRGPHMRVRLPRALHSRGRVPSRDIHESDLEDQGGGWRGIIAQRITSTGAVEAVSVPPPLQLPTQAQPSPGAPSTITEEPLTAQ